MEHTPTTAQSIWMRAEALGPWYHPLQLLPDYRTQTYMKDMEPVWDMVRKVRDQISYTGRSVLDLGTMDGMWAFEAEKLTTGPVVAADIWQGDKEGKAVRRFLLAREALNSHVMPVLNAEVHDLYRRMIPVMRNINYPLGFEIVQCLGLLYHVQNPLMVLQQIWRCMRPGGFMLLETACWTGGDRILPVVRFNRNPPVYEDNSTYWLPNLACLIDWLRLCGFYPLQTTLMLHDQKPLMTQRVALVCEVNDQWKPDENDIGAF